MVRTPRSPPQAGEQAGGQAGRRARRIGQETAGPCRAAPPWRGPQHERPARTGMGRRPLGGAVTWLDRTREPNRTAHGMLVLPEMICEAARYPAFPDAMSRIWVTGGRLPAGAAA
ncbi:ribosome-inactivating family protein [Streptomyces sp. AB3(2024)]|uniref:ribosome-inactivating family protein n=1 Tax=Streptomyces sp. AB3(2024) TaxID=3317321 RepID=UPI0035A3830B